MPNTPANRDLMAELPKTFEPSAIETRWYAHWEGQGLFRPERPDAEPWTIVNPPPNVTGSLHIGHALDNTLQDILTRHARMQGKDALWVVGTDHAGIATQMVVERQLEERQDKRTNYTREQFVEKVWQWKAESGGQITRQLRRLGCSMDWANERFTMDEGFTRAVLKVFVQLYREGLLYRDKRLVNWDPKFQSAISDLEVETREVQGNFWHLRYPLADGSGHIGVATTRPETMLADMAVAVHPTDERYRNVVGKQVRLPITGRLVPIITDEHADPELGSGAVKITPGHDFNDFEVGKRAGIRPADMLNMLDGQAHIVQCGGIPDELVGMDRFDARKRIVELLEAEGALERIEDRTIATPYGDRSGVVIEPWLTDQWYVDAATLAKPAIEAVRSGKIEIVPKTWEKTWFNWLENIQPWCVSRQLWWGHRIPAWYGPELRGDKLVWDVSLQCGETVVAGKQAFVAETETEALRAARQYYGDDQEVILGEIAGIKPKKTANGLPNGFSIVIGRDPDVLDTWFSSALWPFATLGWPDEQPSPLEGEGRLSGAERGEGLSEVLPHPSAASGPSPLPPSPSRGEGSLARHYPNDILISGFDIIFFWDARMAMQGIHFMGDVPWKRLYLHGLVRDAQGQKMSKSKGNTIDPLGLIDRYGADALRFTMAAMESQGRDIKLDEKRVEGYRNFATKLWNAARFLQMNGVGASDSIAAPAAELPVNRWIIGEVVETLDKLDRAFSDLRFDDMANAIYHFTWGSFCDWYVELVKGELSPLPQAGGEEARSAEGEGLSDENSPSPSLSPKREGSGAEETRRVAAWAFDQILVMLHPFMPFVTEELWNANPRPYELIVARWPQPEAAVDRQAKAELDWLIRLVSEVRSARTELNVPPGAKLHLFAADVSAETAARLDRQHATLSRLARLESIQLSPFTGAGAVQVVVDEATYALPLEGVIDLAAERDRLAKALAAAEKERDSLAARLSNPNFTERAKPEAVDKARADHATKQAEAERLSAALQRLG